MGKEKANNRYQWIEDDLKKQYNAVFTEIHPSEGVMEDIIWQRNRSEEGLGNLKIMDFFLTQIKLMPKHWWGLQGLLLVGLWILLVLSNVSQTVQREMSIGATLFIIIMIPELWKNRQYHSMEIEATTVYSLRQVYAAKIIAFGLVDILMLTIFCILAGTVQGISAFDLMKQLVFPLLLAAGSCFAVFCSRRLFSESMAVVICMLVNGFWTMLILQDRLYNAISFGFWIVLFDIAGLFLAYMIWRTVKQCGNCWEGKTIGTKA